MNIKKMILTFFAGLVLGSVAVYAYLELNKYKHPTPWFLIKVYNQSSQAIAVIEAETDLATATHGRLGSGQQLQLPVAHTGAGSYQIRFTLDDGSVCSSGLGYIENGYTVTEVVSDEGVINDMTAGAQLNKCQPPSQVDDIYE